MFEKPRTIKSQWDEYTLLQINELTIKDSDNNTIITGLKAGQYIVEMYGKYKTRSDMLFLWSIYTATHGADFLKAYSAWTDTYNPIENYNANETNVYLTSDGDKNITTTHGKVTTLSADGEDIPTSKNYVTTDESETTRLETQSTQTGTTTDTESGETQVDETITAKSLEIDGTTYTADNVHGEMKNKHGNIGVTTTQQMLQSEVDLRLNPLIQLYIDTFINEYAYYVGGDYFDC